MINTFEDGGVCMKNELFRFLAGMLTISMVLSSASCKKKNVRAERVVKETDPFYSAVETKLEVPLRDDLEVESFDSEAHPFDDCVVMEYRVEYGLPTDLQNKRNEYLRNPESHSEGDWIRLNKEVEEYDISSIAVFDLDGTLRSTTALGKSIIEDIAESSDGRIYAYMVVYEEEMKREYLAVCEILKDGGFGEPNTIDAIPHNEFSMDFYIPDENHFLFTKSETILITDQDGNKIGKISGIPNFGGFVYQVGDKWYAYCDLNTKTGSRVDPSIIEIDIDSGKLVGSPVALQKAPLSLLQGKDGLYSISEKAISKVDILGGTSEIILDWNDTDIVRRNIWEYNIISYDDIYCMAYKDTISEYNGYDIREFTLVHLQKVEKNPHAGKKIIVVACSDELINSSIYEQVVKYNCDPEKKARIIFKSYADDIIDFTVSQAKSDSVVADLVYLDIQSGNGPDVLLGFGSYSQFNTDAMLVDLNTLIDSSTLFDRSKVFDNILRAAETDGRLYQLPMFFYLNGMIGNKKFVGDRTSWTISDFDAMVQTLPQDTEPLAQISQQDLLVEMTAPLMNRFMDYGRKQVNFDTPEFRSILEFVKKYGTPKDEMNNIDINDISFISSNDKLKNEMIAGYLYSIQIIDYYAFVSYDLGDCAAFIGDPSFSGGGMMAIGRNSFGITANSLYKEEAMDFLWSLLSKDCQTEGAEDFLTGLPILKEAFDEVYQHTKHINDIQSENEKNNPFFWGENTYPDYGPETYEGLITMIENSHSYASYDTSAMLIILEEAPGYFTGQRSLDDVVKNIQNRCTTIVNERG